MRRESAGSAPVAPASRLGRSRPQPAAGRSLRQWGTPRWIQTVGIGTSVCSPWRMPGRTRSMTVQLISTPPLGADGPVLGGVCLDTRTGGSLMRGPSMSTAAERDRTGNGNGTMRCPFHLICMRPGEECGPIVASCDRRLQVTPRFAQAYPVARAGIWADRRQLVPLDLSIEESCHGNRSLPEEESCAMWRRTRPSASEGFGNFGVQLFAVSSQGVKNRRAHPVSLGLSVGPPSLHR